MSLNGFFYDGKAKSGSLFILAPGQVCLVEALPDLVQRVTRDPDPVILDGDIDLFSAFGGFDGNGGFWIAEFNRIVQKIV